MAITVPPRLVALDIDGTLLDSTRRVGARTRAALTRAKLRGWHVVVATGRPAEVALPVVHDLALGEYLVAANGATVAHVHSGTVVYQASLPGALVAEAVRRARVAVPGIGLAVTTPRGMFSEPRFEEVAPLTVHLGETVADAAPLHDEPVESAVLFRVGDDALELCARLAAVAPDGVAVTPSGLPGTVEFVVPGTHKGDGLARLCALLAISREEVVAFGDGLNDREMLAWAGFGVAMGNADAGTKAVADHVTASNDHDGVALVVERLLAAPGPG